MLVSILLADDDAALRKVISYKLRRKGCEVAAVCGGGCAALADAQGHGIGGPDCRPVKELYGIGARFYGL